MISNVKKQAVLLIFQAFRLYGLKIKLRFLRLFVTFFSLKPYNSKKRSFTNFFFLLAHALRRNVFLFHLVLGRETLGDVFLCIEFIGTE